MANVTGLVGELRRQVSELEKDLRARVDGPDSFARQEGVAERWIVEHQQALKAKRTAASWQAWRDERVTQAAVAWVLLTVFARFCEDNELVSKVWIAGPSRERRQQALDARRAYFQAHPEHNDRHWLMRTVDHFAAAGATAGLVDKYSPLHQVAPSGDAARQLLEFWWEQDASGRLLRRFGPDVNPKLDTRFLGDLYQDLSEFAKKNYALLQTPEFVEEFILDQTFEPALAERPLEGFSVIDPACGSGHFLLGMFHRLLDRWAKHAPNLESRELVQKALDSVHGVDLNPFAVSIARFRLIVAALKATGDRSLEKAPHFHINLANGDSLIYGAHQQTLSDEMSNAHAQTFSYSIENLPLLKKVLHSTYDVVVGNPPYVTPKDKALNSTYRELYETCHRKYALTAPFMELFFSLARSGARPGWIGQITSNSFMKRVFGVPLVERFLARKDLRLVVDTSGAYIPGHGTPTVILAARNQGNVDETVRAVLGIRGEPGRPEVASKGIVWCSIVNHVDDPGFDNGWITVTDLDRALLAEHPWSLPGGGAVETLGKIDAPANETVRMRALRIGFFGVIGCDEALTIPSSIAKSRKSFRSGFRSLVLGDDVRDFSLSTLSYAFFPYSPERELSKIDSFPEARDWLWPYRTELGNRANFGDGTYATDGRPWYEWHQMPRDETASPLAITFAFVATHNHFVLDRQGMVFNRSAPVIKLPEGATEDKHLMLLGVLNSSAACFWLKQKSHNKGGTVDNTGARTTISPWENFYEFTGTTLQDFPLPAILPLEGARRIDSLAQELAKHTPQAVAEAGPPTRDTLDAVRAEHEHVRAQMIFLQEELDWEVYRLYGLIDDDLTYSGDLQGIVLGERAFEIALARAVQDGEYTAWFERHRSTPITEIPASWPSDYRDLVQRRLDLIASNMYIRLLEKPEYKRRWASDPWDKRVRSALKDWLFNRLEDRALWFDQLGRPRPRSVAQLADDVERDRELTGVLEVWADQPDIPVAVALQNLLQDQVVPFLAAYRYKESGMDKRVAWEETWRLQRKEDAGETRDSPIAVPPKYKPTDFVKPAYWQHRGKLDVPKERFVLYPDAGRDTDPTPLLGWAGWDHAQQALALATIMNEREAEGWPDERLVPLIAGLAELQPWVRQWHGDIDPTYGVSLAAIVDEELASRTQRAGKTTDELAAWRPPAPGRSRSKRGSKT